MERHGSICAYCGEKVSPSTITLDHVTPRRGQSAYDRRDNLVLACRDCNAAKADSAALVFLLADRTRAVNLLHYGSHLSPMLVDLARQLAGHDGEVDFDALDFEMMCSGESPYLDDEESPYLD